MHFQDQAHILMRYRVIVTPIVNMVINVDLGPLDLDVLIRMQRQGSKTGCSKRLNVSSRLPGICLKGLRISSSKSSLILAFSCASEQNRQCRRRARIQLSMICTDSSTLALSLDRGDGPTVLQRHNAPPTADNLDSVADRNGRLCSRPL